MTMKEAIESSTKEAIYALDYGQGPLNLYNCLIPEIEARRSLGQALKERDLRLNYEAKLKFATIELKQ